MTTSAFSYLLNKSTLLVLNYSTEKSADYSTKDVQLVQLHNQSEYRNFISTQKVIPNAENDFKMPFILILICWKYKKLQPFPYPNSPKV